MLPPSQPLVRDYFQSLLKSFDGELEMDICQGSVVRADGRSHIARGVRDSRVPSEEYFDDFR